MLPVSTIVKGETQVVLPGPLPQNGGPMNLPVSANCDATERARPVPPLTFPAILSDPLVRLVMKADGVDPKELERELWDIASGLPASKNRNLAKAASELRC